jgi:hypothetical protein
MVMLDGPCVPAFESGSAQSEVREHSRAPQPSTHRCPCPNQMRPSLPLLATSRGWFDLPVGLGVKVGPCFPPPLPGTHRFSSPLVDLRGAPLCRASPGSSAPCLKAPSPVQQSPQSCLPSSSCYARPPRTRSLSRWVSALATKTRESSPPRRRPPLRRWVPAADSEVHSIRHVRESSRGQPLSRYEHTRLTREHGAAIRSGLCAGEGQTAVPLRLNVEPGDVQSTSTCPAPPQGDLEEGHRAPSAPTDTGNRPARPFLSRYALVPPCGSRHLLRRR